MKKFLEAIMYALSARKEKQQPVLPTGPNPLPPLSDFEVKRTKYALSLHVPFGMYQVDIDVSKGVGFFQHAVCAIQGQFWLAGNVLLESDHLLPADVKAALRSVSIEV